MIDGSDVLMLIITFVVVVVVVMTHYEGLHFFTKWMSRNTLKPRFRIALMIYGLLILHGIEILLFGIAYWLITMPTAEGVNVLSSLTFRDYAYFSATVYSTLGFDGLSPTQPMRLLASIESVTGLLLITWSASFTYLEMVRYWRDSD